MATLAYTPTVQEVARYLRARTRAPSGAEVGTFDSTTVPTDEQVEALIDLAVPFVAGMVGDVPKPCEQGARSLVALKAAEMIEISYYPEQLAPGGSVSALRALYADLLPSVQACVSSDGEGGGGADGDGTPGSSCFFDVVDYDGSRGGSVPPYGRYIDGVTPTIPVVRIIEAP
jgi:hypothetical protein